MTIIVKIQYWIVFSISLCLLYWCSCFLHGDEKHFLLKLAFTQLTLLYVISRSERYANLFRNAIRVVVEFIVRL
ncbi:snurportin-1 [Trichinella spiralis]|uniref:snurportin-1 n=1 Tax=Trichinella spiralis TaxID=6334 RepID=UPI0001EFEAB3|nr:snurportin-1 [Trichinella spiralis]